MLDDDIGHAAIGGDGLEKCLERFQAASAGAERDESGWLGGGGDFESGRRKLLSATRGGRPGRALLPIRTTLS